jgi:hypothetical protein
MDRLIGGSATVAIVVIGVAVTLISFLSLDAYAGDSAYDRSQEVKIIYDEASGEAAALSEQAMTELMDLKIWVGLLSINLGLAAAVGAGLIAGVVCWRRRAASERSSSAGAGSLPPRPSWGPTMRSFLFALLLIGATQIVTLQIDAIGTLNLDPPIEPEDLVPRLFQAASWVTLVGVVVGFFAVWALLWVREAAAADWSAGLNRRREWIVALRGIATPLLAGLSLMIVAAVFATGALTNMVELAFGDAISVVNGVAVMFGALLSIVLALAYLPTHAALERQAQSIVDEVVPISLEPFDESAVKRRKVLVDLVHANQTGRSSLEENLLIAGPLISSLVTVLLS